MPVLPDNSAETQYIRQLGQKLVGTIPSQHSWPFEFHVVAQKEINAFALPGGPMFINVGTITAAANEAQLAGVMAHEMSHVYMQHSAKQARKAQTTGMLAGIAGAVLGATTGGAVQQLGGMGLQMGAQGLMLKYSRSDESQADAVGAVILHKAGYNPHSMADFFKTLESQGGGHPPQWLSDHPNPGNREQAIEKEIRNWPPEKYASDRPAFQKIRQHAMGVRAYTADLSPFPGPNGQPDKERDWLVTIPRPDGSIIFMVFVAAQSYFERFEPTYAAMLKERAVLARYNRPRQKSLLESADARVWRLRHPAGEKSCPAKGQNNPLNSDLPSHGRR